MSYSHGLRTRDIKANIETKLSRYLGCTPREAGLKQVYHACAMTVKDILTEERIEFRNNVGVHQKKRVYYMCMEFLLGRSLKNNLYNLGLVEKYRKALFEMGFTLEDLYECEPDAGLGNGGLGRLAACFMDSLTTFEYPAYGFSICYEYGLFKQKIVDGLQVELPDVWLPGGEVWLVPIPDRTYRVRFGGHIKENWSGDTLTITYEDCEEIDAVPYDMMISGSDCDAVNQLRLWKAKNVRNFNFGLFTQGQYARAVEESANAEIISKILYPSDNHDEGKLLRLTQQYFLVSASCQSIIHDHLTVYGTLENLPDKIAIHINDTHPALCIPELIRILTDEHKFDFNKAWDFTQRIFSYTNHTVMPEALETWNEDLFKLKLPRLYMVIKQINDYFGQKAWEVFPNNWKRIADLCPISYGQIHMARLAVISSHSINGVSALHTAILCESLFKDYYFMYPERFVNVTNGIAHRRWLCYSNPRLSALIDSCIGTEYRKDPNKLLEFANFAKDKGVLDELYKIKHENKVDFSKRCFDLTGEKINPDSVFDVHIKRIHEYKRQLLNALNIIGLYLDLQDDPNIDVVPKTFIFGGKAASGYYIAKQIIKLICLIAKDINSNPRMREKLRVVFLEDYNVSTAEILIPSSEISEQISLAGKEASGTGCMKMMINGAITIGTLDGANAEMLEAVGGDNIYIFGLNFNEVDELWLRGYNSAEFYACNERLMRIVNQLKIGFAGETFSDIAKYLLSGERGVGDPYMCLADFQSYKITHEKLIELYQNQIEWNKKSLYNIAGAGYFSADRSISEYVQRIWHIEEMGKARPL